MALYDTTALALAIIGEEKVTANRKSATRTLRKFLRNDFTAREVPTPGKGGRYSIELKAAELRAMKKRFTAWAEAEAKAQEARRAALAPKATPAPVEDAPADDAPAIIEDDSTDEVEGPSDEELASLLDEIESEGTEG